MKKVKRFLSICIVTAIALSLFGAGYILTSAKEVLGDELVSDGGFENAAVGINIPLTDKDIQSGMFIYSASEAVVSDTLAHSGQHALKVTRKSSLDIKTEMSVNYRLPLKKGQKYKLSAWVRFAPDYEGTGSFYIRMTDVGSDFAWADRGLVTDMIGSNDFVKIEAVCTPSTDYEKARINIGVASSTQEAVAYFDDLSCVEVMESGEEPDPGPSEEPEPDDGNLIANSGFETELTPGFPRPADCTAARSTEQAHEGNYSYKLVQTKNYGAANYSPLNLTAGKSYYYRAWARLEDTNTGTTDFYIRLLWNDGGTDGQKYSQKVSGKDGWTILEGITEIPSDKEADKCRLNIAANPINNQPVTYYIDDVVLKELPDPTLQNAVWNQVGDLDGVPVCPTDAEVKLVFGGAIDKASLTAETILLNGEPTDADSVNVSTDSATPEQVTVRFTGLDFSKRYTISLAEQSWKDEFKRAVTMTPLSFKTSGRVAIRSKKLYIDNVEVTDGKLKNGTVRTEVSGLKNMSGTAENVTAVLVLFRDGEMVGINSNTVSVPSGSDSTVKAETDLNVSMDGSGVYELKLFVWDDLKSGLSLSTETVLRQ